MPVRSTENCTEIPTLVISTCGRSMEKLMFSSHTIGLQLQMMKMYGNDRNNVIQCLFIFVLIDGIHSCIYIYIYIYIYLLKLYYGKIYPWDCLVSRQGNELILFSSQERKTFLERTNFDVKLKRLFLSLTEQSWGPRIVTP